MRTFLPRATMLAACLLAPAVAPVNAQQGAKNGEWPTYGGDLGNTRYSPLDQINANNFNRLELAWRFKTDNLGPRAENNLEGTPLMAKGVVYTTAGSRRDVASIGHECIGVVEAGHEMNRYPARCVIPPSRRDTSSATSSRHSLISSAYSGTCWISRSEILTPLRSTLRTVSDGGPVPTST